MPTPKDVLDDPVLLLPEVERLTRLSGTTIWRRERAGKFPPRRKQGRYCVWFRSEIVAYLEALRAETSGPAPANTNATQARRQAARRRRAQRKTGESERRSAPSRMGDEDLSVDLSVLIKNRK
jgi:predicted DNA-binding transcriptional regulator AlpA